MRIRGLGESGRLGAAVLILATWMLACLALLAGWRYADAKGDLQAVCVSRETFTQIQIANGHPIYSGKISPGTVAAALAFSNQFAPKPIEADDISFFMFTVQPVLLKIVFWNKGCYVDDGLLNGSAAQKLLEAGEGPGI